MAKSAARYVCQNCGASTARWGGRCDSCGAWNSIVEEAPREALPKGLSGKKGKGIELVDLGGPVPETMRRSTGMAEFDRVTGGGLVRGSAILIGGDPGIGKSTLLLQVVVALGRLIPRMVSAYISGEEAVEQVQLRGRRLQLGEGATRLAAATNIRDIIATLETGEPPEVVVIDSIQTMYLDTLDSAPGTVAQVRSCSAELIRVAKRRGFVLMLDGHVTKDGQIAGPRVLEHMVDTVLYFEGERGHQFRILRSVKNRFGPANEIGVFEMAEAGLVPVANPSALFLADREDGIAGSAVFAGMEGTRPLLVEIQALVAPSGLGTPRRAVVGWDGNRLAMLLAVLEARCGLVMSTRDVYLNVAGGLRVQEPAADLAVAAAIISSELGHPVPLSSVFFGEVGLAGEVRPVGHADARLKEAGKLGFLRAVMPRTAKELPSGLRLEQLARLDELAPLLGGAECRSRKPGR